MNWALKFGEIFNEKILSKKANKLCKLFWTSSYTRLQLQTCIHLKNLIAKFN